MIPRTAAKCSSSSVKTCPPTKDAISEEMVEEEEEGKEMHVELPACKNVDTRDERLDHDRENHLGKQ